MMPMPPTPPKDSQEPAEQNVTPAQIVCGCKIVVVAEQGALPVVDIQYCALHGAASLMLSKLKGVLGWLRPPDGNDDQRSVSEMARFVRGAIDKAEGR